MKPDVSLRPGSVLEGKYEVEEVLGIGAMGMVVGARHVQLETRVAIKCLLPRHDRDERVAARFRREARAAAMIDSPHIVRVIDVGDLPGGSPYMVMERLEGEDLDQHLRRQGPLDVRTVCTFGLQVCEALAAAHARGIVHRDIKPANLFLTHAADGSAVIKVLDFGISKNVAAEGASVLTKTDSSLGSPLYMSPEQMRSGRDVDHRTDIWSLGVVLFQLLTTNLPFTAANMPQLCAVVLENDAPLVTTLRAEVPEPIAALVARCLRKDRQDRPADVREVARVLASLLGADGIRALERIDGLLRNRRYGAAVHVTAQQGTAATSSEADGVLSPQSSGRAVGLANRDAPPRDVQTTAPWSGERHRRQSHSGRRRLGLGALAVVAGLLAVLVFGSDDESPPPSKSSAGFADVGGGLPRTVSRRDDLLAAPSNDVPLEIPAKRNDAPVVQNDAAKHDAPVVQNVPPPLALPVKRSASQPVPRTTREPRYDRRSRPEATAVSTRSTSGSNAPVVDTAPETAPTASHDPVQPLDPMARPD